MKNNNINPTGLKGNDHLSRMRSLMGVTPITENTKTSVVELTKTGPDGKVYGIVRENHKYFIKITNKKQNLIAEDFRYMGGLQNKTEKSYDSYSQATKQLNLKFLSLNESLDKTVQINVLQNDNLLAESFDSYSEKPKKSQPDSTLGTVKTAGQNNGPIDGMPNEKSSPDVDTPPVVEESDEADEDYDGDGKIESSEDEYMGSKDKAIKDALSEDDVVELTENEKAIDNIILELKAEALNENKPSITTAIHKIKEGEESSKKKA
jgi:hypothetical protein|tara:strand:- start:84 stop:875 length:792 start_codon:yes stop_codon:yes gene_type:complete